MAISYTFQEAALSVAHTEFHPGRTEEGSAGSWGATRILRCAWADRMKLETELLGITTVSGEQINVIRPHRFPDPDRQEALAVSVTKKGFDRAKSDGGDTKVIAYTTAQLTVTYRTPDGDETPSQDEDDPDVILVTESLEPVAQFQTLPGVELFYNETPKKPVPESFGVARILQLTDWVYTIHQNPFIPDALVDPVFGIVGRVNNACLQSKRLKLSGGRFMKFEAETLLLNSPSLERQITVEGVQSWRITVRMTHNPDGWNKFRRTAFDVTPKKLVDSGGNKKDVYQSADFRNIINAELATC